MLKDDIVPILYGLAENVLPVMSPYHRWWTDTKISCDPHMGIHLVPETVLSGTRYQPLPTRFLSVCNVDSTTPSHSLQISGSKVLSVP